MKTSAENVYAAGDIVEFPLFMVGDEKVNIGHWQMAHKHGQYKLVNDGMMIAFESEVISQKIFEEEILIETQPTMLPEFI